MSLPPSGVFTLSFFRFAFGVSLPFGLCLAFVYCSGVLCLLPCSGFLFIIVRCLSGCRITLLFFLRLCPVLSCLFLFLSFFVVGSGMFVFFSLHTAPLLDRQPRTIWSNERYTNIQVMDIAGHSLPYVDMDFLVRTPCWM